MSKCRRDACRVKTFILDSMRTNPERWELQDVSSGTPKGHTCLENEDWGVRVLITHKRFPLFDELDVIITTNEGSAMVWLPFLKRVVVRKAMRDLIVQRAVEIICSLRHLIVSEVEVEDPEDIESGR